MDQNRADLPAMKRFAAASWDRRDELRRLRAQMDSVRVSRESFGYILDIGSRVYAAYDEFVDGCADALCSAADTMGSIAEALNGTAATYASADASAEAAVGQIKSGMAGLDVRDAT